MKTLMLGMTLLLAGCTSSGISSPDPLPNSSAGYTYTTVYLPYVQEVILPVEIHEGEEIVVKRVVQSPLRPDILSGTYRDNVLYWPLWDESLQGFQGYELDGWMWGPFEVPQSTNTYTSVLPALPAGTYKLRIGSARTPEEGGISGLYVETPSLQPPNPELVEYKEYDLKVLPKL